MHGANREGAISGGCRVMPRGEERSLVSRSTKIVVLTVPTEREPEVYLVCSDVFGTRARCSP